MHTYAFVLGSQPALSAVEILSYFQRLGLETTVDPALLPTALTVTARKPIDAQDVLQHLGGTPIIVRLHGTITAFTPAELFHTLPNLREHATPGRTLGLSLAGFRGSSRSSAREIRAFGMGIKRMLDVRGLRMVLPQHGVSLTSAQLFHAGIPTKGLGLVLFPTDHGFHVGTVEAVQDIRAYAERDRGRPHADPGRGMLPPKVAQIFVNLSLAPPRGTIYDPFCGVGTIPMEAWLMGLRVIASDRSPTQVQRTEKNLHWLTHHAPWPVPYAPEWRIFAHDMTEGSPPPENHSVDAIVTEGWLGPALTHSPLPREADRIFADVQRYFVKVLYYSKALLRKEGRIVIAVPAFRVRKRLRHFPLEKLSLRGLRLESLAPKELDHPIFRESARGTLVYGRPHAIVLREIVRLRNVA